MDETIQFSGYSMTTEVGPLERRDRPSLDLSGVDSMDPEVEAHLLPTERAILQNLREYAKEVQEER